MISVTDLTAYMYCPRKLYFAKVLGIREKPQEASIKGKIKHAVFDAAGREDRVILSGFSEKDSLEDIEMLYRKMYYRLLLVHIQIAKKDLEAQHLQTLAVFQELWPFFLEEAREKSRFFFGLAKEKKVYGETLWLSLPKGVSELRIVSEKLGLIGVVDKVELGEDFVPIEIKTGKAPADGVWRENMIQLGAYMLLLSEHYGKEIKEGYVEYRAIQERRKITMNPFLKDEILALIQRVDALLKDTELPKRTRDEWKCVHCGVRDECYSRPD